MKDGVTEVKPRSIRLRPFLESDLELFRRFATDADFSLPFEWGGFASIQSYRRRFERDGFLEEDPHFLAVANAEGEALGWVMWRDPLVFGRKGWAWEIGVLLAPEHRGKGVGTAAQRMLVDYLFETTAVHRLTANTEPDNAAEQRCLEKCGFRREGLLRRAGFRSGRWRDVLVHARLRDEEDA